MQVGWLCAVSYFDDKNRGQHCGWNIGIMPGPHQHHYTTATYSHWEFEGKKWEKVDMKDVAQNSDGHFEI